MAEPIVYVNGDFVPESNARISVLDHAVLYGDGIFETAFASNGHVFKLDAHIDRGFRSMAAISLSCPVSRRELRDLVLETIRRNDLREAYIKWIVTRGSNGKPLMDPAGCTPNLIILVRPYISRASQEQKEQGLQLKTVAVRRPPGEVLDPHIKSLNYLNLVLAKLEARAAGADEALLLDIRGRICEATGCNIFLVHGRTLSTPRHDILEGITRESVLELAADIGFTVHESDLELYDAYTADEIFMGSTAGGLLPIVNLDGRVIGDGNPGRSFLEVLQAYRELISSGRYGTDAYADG